MPNPNNELVSHSIPGGAAGAEMAAVRGYWTKERMAEAKPIPFEIEESTLGQLADRAEPEGEFQSMASVPADSALAVDPLGDQPIQDLAAATGLVPDCEVSPYAAVGKMFMQFAGTNYVGTAWSIAERAVFTAGHCVFDRDDGGWADSVLFMPQYEGDIDSPVGSWVGTRLVALNGWTESRDFRYDLAAFEVDRPIRPSTGTLGWMANYPPNQGIFRSIGYPAADPFDGRHMWQSVGNYIDGSNPMQMENDMTGGCSGGPWLARLGGDVRANGLNSHRHTNNPATIYSPYFGEGFLNIYNDVKSDSERVTGD